MKSGHEMNKITLSVDGMSCQGCADSLTRRFEGEQGVGAVKVSYETKSAELEYDADLLTEARLSEIVKEAGFQLNS
jgi:copper chaperone